MGQCKQCKTEIPNDSDDSMGFCPSPDDACWKAWCRAQTEHDSIEELEVFPAIGTRLARYVGGPPISVGAPSSRPPPPSGPGPLNQQAWNDVNKE